MKQGGSWYYYLADGLGSTMAVVNASGVVQNSYTYDVYGEATKTGSLANEFDFAGQQTDSTGLQYLRARYMDPETGTFLSRDPMALLPLWSSNANRYASASPASLSDPSGLCPKFTPKWVCTGASGVKSGASDAVDSTASAVESVVDTIVDGNAAVTNAVLDLPMTLLQSLAPPYVLNDLLNGIQLVDLIPFAAICLEHPACKIVELGIGGAAFLAGMIQFFNSNCGPSEFLQFVNLASANWAIEALPNPAVQAALEIELLASQNALLNSCATAVAPLAEKGV